MYHVTVNYIMSGMYWGPSSGHPSSV